MNEFYIRNVIEAALLAAGKPLQLAEIGQLFDETTRPKVEDLRATIDTLAAEYASRGIEVKETAAGFRIQVRREFSAEVSRLWPERPARYSRALLETLALIAYRQPITRAEIEAVRGVAVNPNIVKTVIERNWVRVVGHRDVPGRPELLGTTREFLDYFGLRSLDELPPLAELKAMGDYNLQLELPNGATPEGEPKLVAGPEGEGGAPVAGLLTSDQPANAENVAAEGTDTDAAGDADAVVARIADADADPVGDDADDGAADAVGHDATNHAVADEFTEADAVADAAGEVTDAVAHTAEADEITDTDASEGDEAAHDATTNAATADDAARSQVADTSATTDAVAHDADSDTEAEAERTLSAGESSKHTPADPDDSDSTSPTSSESSDALDDSADDEADEDELSADGHGSRELVAAPRDLED